MSTLRKTVRVNAHIGPEQRLADAIAPLPAPAQAALSEIAGRTDLPLVAGSWEGGEGGCLVANVVRALETDTTGANTGVGSAAAATFDLRVLELLPELSSRDLNKLIVAWDEAADQEGRGDDATLRRLLRGALLRAGVVRKATTAV